MATFKPHLDSMFSGAKQSLQALLDLISWPETYKHFYLSSGLGKTSKQI